MITLQLSSYMKFTTQETYFASTIPFLLQSACVLMLDWFEYHGHICIAFELLGLSTYDFLKENNFQPFPVEHIRHMAHQVIRAVQCE